MVREEDRLALKRIISTIFTVENDHKAELAAVLNDESLSPEEKANKYIDVIIDYIEYYPEGDDDTEEREVK